MPMQVHALSQSTQEEAERKSGGLNWPPLFCLQSRVRSSTIAEVVLWSPPDLMSLDLTSMEGKMWFRPGGTGEMDCGAGEVEEDCGAGGVVEDWGAGGVVEDWGADGEVEVRVAENKFSFILDWKLAW